MTEEKKIPSLKAELPSWCKGDAWVVAKFDLEMNKRVKDCVLKRIAEVDSFGGITAKTLKGEREYGGWSEYLPIRFRPYKYEEAEKLLGTALRYKYKNARRITLVHDVYDGVHDNEGHVCINSLSQSWLQEHDATIDGVPFGVPEVDEKAMKGGEK